MERFPTDSGPGGALAVIIRSMGRPTLERALESVRQQGLQGLEVCVVDAQGQGRLGPRLRPFTDIGARAVGQGEALSRAAAAQLGLEAAQGRLALFLDDDDELLPGHLRKLFDELSVHPELVAVHTGVEQVRLSQEGVAGDIEVLGSWNRAFEPWELLLANALPIHAVLFDRVRVLEAGVRFDERFDVFEDWDFWLQVLRLGPVGWVPGISARYWATADQTQSMAARSQHGDPHYRAIWAKWWDQAPAAWWSSALLAGREQPWLRTRLEQSEQAREWAEGGRRSAEQFLLLANERLAAADRERLVHEQRIAGLSDELEQAQSLVRQWRSRHDLAEQALGQAQTEAAASRAHVQALMSSRSWRATAPLRWLGRQGRRMRDLASPSGLGRLAWRLRHRSYPRPGLLQAVLPDPYRRWLDAEESDREGLQAQALAEIARWADQPLLSVVMPVFDPPLAFLDEALASLQAQWYQNWEICIADDASTTPGLGRHLDSWMRRDRRIRCLTRSANGHISAASNSALSLARGQWVVLMDQDDRLHPQALWRVAQAIHAHPQAAVLYSDEDKINEQGQRFGPYFKPAFDLDLLRGQNMISHLGVYRLDLVQDVGGFREGFEGSQDHDLALRCVERLRPDQVVHIPRVLYHWRVHERSAASGEQAKPYAANAALRAVSEHLQRCSVPAGVERHPRIPHLKVNHLGGEAVAGGLAVLAWGLTAQERQGVAADLQRLFGEGNDALLSRAEIVCFPTWLQALAQLKSMSMAQACPTAVLLVWAPALRGATLGAGSITSALAHLAEPGVAAVGWARRDSGQRLLDAGWLLCPDGLAKPLMRGADGQESGYYGQSALAHQVSALDCGAVFLKPQMLDPSAAGLQAVHSSRLVWTPECTWTNLAATTGLEHGVASTAGDTPLLRRSGTGVEGRVDPSYSPHLCAGHADCRLADEPPRQDSDLLRPRFR